MKMYKALEPDDGVIAQFAAVHLVRWEREWGEPKLLFVEAEPADLLKEEHVKAVIDALMQLRSILQDNPAVRIQSNSLVADLEFDMIARKADAALAAFREDKNDGE